MLPPPADPSDLDELVELIRAAGDLTLEWFRSDRLAVDHKGDGTPVTEADRAAERLLRDELARRHPTDAVIGEEHPDTTGTSGRTWIIDPIDGTKAFTRGVPLYSNLIALDDEHGPLLGAINLPALGETVYAGRGLGCFVDGAAVSVNDTTDLGRSLVTTSGFGAWWPELMAEVEASGALLRSWGDGFGYALVATGRAEVMIDPSAAHWDLAPMGVIMAEAGGRFSDLAGRPIATGGGGVATNGRLHDELLALWRRAEDARG